MCPDGCVGPAVSGTRLVCPEICSFIVTADQQRGKARRAVRAAERNPGPFWKP
jgi:hypothetical protein